MQPPRPDRHPWHDDQLGSLVRRGLPETWRGATPSPEVWQNIARQIEAQPPAARPQRLDRFRRSTGDPGARHGGARWVSLWSSALALSAALSVGLFLIGDMVVLQERHRVDPCGSGAATCAAGGAGQPTVATDAPPARVAAVPPFFRVARVDPVAMMDPVALVAPVQPLPERQRWVFRFATFEVAEGEWRARLSGEQTQATFLSDGRRVAPKACLPRGLRPDASQETRCIY